MDHVDCGKVPRRGADAPAVEGRSRIGARGRAPAAPSPHRAANGPASLREAHGHRHAPSLLAHRELMDQPLYTARAAAPEHVRDRNGGRSPVIAAERIARSRCSTSRRRRHRRTPHSGEPSRRARRAARRPRESQVPAARQARRGNREAAATKAPAQLAQPPRSGGQRGCLRNPEGRRAARRDRLRRQCHIAPGCAHRQARRGAVAPPQPRLGRIRAWSSAAGAARARPAEATGASCVKRSPAAAETRSAGPRRRPRSGAGLRAPISGAASRAGANGAGRAARRERPCLQLGRCSAA